MAAPIASLPTSPSGGELPRQPVSSAPFRSLRTGFTLLDEAFPDVLLPGKPVLLTAPRDALSGLEHRLILSALSEGGSVAIVSGDNRLDAYRILGKARRMGLETEACDHVHLARAFTVHQLASLLEETLPRMAADPGCRLVLASGLLALYLDEDVRHHEGATLLRRGLRALERIQGPVVVASAPSQSLHWGRGYILSRLGQTYLRETPSPDQKQDRAQTLSELMQTLVPERVEVTPATQGSLRVRLPRRGAEVLVGSPGFVTLDDFFPAGEA